MPGILDKSKMNVYILNNSRMEVLYSNSKITVIWDSGKCIKSGNCDGQLPQVFNPHKRPWINLEGAPTETIMRVIDSCPSGALSYRLPGEKKSKTATINIIKDGPYKVSGECRLVNEDGDNLETGNVFALCRCGNSRKMPFCDGSHYSTGLHGK
jgi:uncharacterized Fe-S cluster protein YjdI